MTMLIDKKLQDRERTDDPIQVGILGAGEMSMGLVNQIVRYTPGMRVAALYNRTHEKAIKVLESAGIQEKSIVTASTGEEVDDAINANKGEEEGGGMMGAPTAVVRSPSCLWTSTKIDAVVEMTGTIHEAFEWICSALEHGKKVVSFNAELDATVGPYLQRKARECGTLYTLGDGDQPGVTLNLYRQVKLMGFTPLVCGNIKGFLDNHRTPETQRGFAEQMGLSATMVTSFADGTKVALEQASIANATGMRVAKRGMLGIEYDGHVDDLVDRYDIDELKKLGGIVEMVVGAKPGPGVFVFATTDDPVSKRFLAYGKLGKGPLYSFYVPYHLLFFELPFSVARLVDFNDGTLDALPEGLHVETIAVAKKDLKAGETLDGLGGFAHYGVCENSNVVRDEGLLPAGLADGKVLKRDVARDEAIRWDDVEEMNGSSPPVDVAYRSIQQVGSTSPAATAPAP